MTNPEPLEEKPISRAERMRRDGVLHQNELASHKWRLARDVIEHEDNLIHHRSTTYVTLQAFLFAAIGVGFTALGSGKDPKLKYVVIFFAMVLSILGLATSSLLAQSLRAASRHIMAIDRWWHQQTDDADRRAFPPLIGIRAASWWGLFLKKMTKDFEKDLGCQWLRNREDWPQPSYRVAEAKKNALTEDEWDDMEKGLNLHGTGFIHYLPICLAVTWAAVFIGGLVVLAKS